MRLRYEESQTASALPEPHPSWQRTSPKPSEAFLVEGRFLHEPPSFITFLLWGRATDAFFQGTPILLEEAPKSGKKYLAP